MPLARFLSSSQPLVPAESTPVPSTSNLKQAQGSQQPKRQKRSGPIIAPKAVHIEERPSRPLYSLERAGVAQSLPVYSDIRNGGSRQEVLIRKVRGDLGVSLMGIYAVSVLNIVLWCVSLQALAQDIRTTFGTQQTSKLRITVKSNNGSVVIGGQGAPAVHEIKDWLAAQGH